MEIGKPKQRVLSKTVLRLSGARSKDIIIGPSFGVDVAIVGVSERSVMVANCDPISLMPELGPRDSAVMSVHEVASDVATSGQAPRYALFDLNLPPKASDHTLQTYWKSISRECERMGTSIVGGHTGRFEGCDYSIVGSATMWTICKKDEYLTSSMARDRDDLVLTKSAAYGATAVLARAFPRTFRRFAGASLCQEAINYFARLNTVGDSLAAVSGGIHDRGITAIHDVTEGGVFAAVYEMAAASGIGCSVDVEAIPVSEPTIQVSKLFRIDPMVSLGEGSLLLACRPQKTTRVIELLGAKSVDATLIGRFSSRLRGVRLHTRAGNVGLAYPERDPYWMAFSRASRQGWR
jgi:hydrogenase expression/formation protein HypE